MKLLTSISLLISLLFLLSINMQAQYFSQQFSQALTAGNVGGGTKISNTSVTSDPVYVSDPASDTQFTFLSTNNAADTIEISGDGVMRMNRAGTGTVYIVRNTNFTGSPGALMVSLDFNCESNNSNSSGAVQFMLGQSFANSNSEPSSSDKHSLFYVNTKNAPTNAWGVNSISGSSASAFTTTETITWYVNNSSSSISYIGPDGSSNTIADDTYDLWVANTLYYDDAPANSSTASLNNFEIRIGGGNGTYTVDNILIQEIPPPYYFSQQFSQALTSGNLGGGTRISNTGVTLDPVYVNDLASSTQFTYLSNNNDLDTLEISGDGVMRMTRPGSGTFYIVRNTDFVGSPGAVMLSLDFNAESTAGTSGGALEFMLGQNFANSNNNPSSSDKHSVFFVNTKSPTGTPGTWGVNAISGSSSSSFTTTETITWYVNNSGSSILYIGPDGSSNTIADDTYDLWVANTLYYDDAVATSSTASLSDFEIRIAGGNGTYTVDNILIQDIPSAGTPPTVTTTAITDITQTSATSGGTVTNEGTSPVTARGVCWSTSENPTTADDKTVDGSGAGSFTSFITGLLPGTTYYVRAYAISLDGTGYGNQEMFTTVAGVADIVLSSDNPAVPSRDIIEGSLKNPVYKFNLAVSINNTQLNQVDFVTQGTYTSSDISRLQLWFNTADNLGGAVQIGSDITPTRGGDAALSFVSLTQDINVGETGYLWITADVSETPTIGGTISVDAVTTADITFSSGNKSGTAFNGGLQTISASAYFRTIATGDWNATTTWETSLDSVVWVTASSTPTDASKYIHIRSPHTVTVTEAVSVDQVIVDAGATININAVVLTMVDGPDSIDVKVGGNFINGGDIVADGWVQFLDGSNYQHIVNSSTVPNGIWETGSTATFTGIEGQAPANRNQSYYNIIWNCPNQSSNLNMGFNGVTIGGDINIISTGASNRWYLCGPSTGESVEVTINGNIIQTGGEFSSQGTGNSNTTVDVTIQGNITVTGGNFACTRGSQGGTGTTTWYLFGDNFSMSNATTQNSNTTDANAKFLFSGTTQQNLTLTNVTFGGGFPVEVATGAILDVGMTQLHSSGIFTLNDGATLQTAIDGGLDSLLQTSGTITLGTTANYTFNGTEAQVTGTLLPSTVNDLTVENSAGVTLSGDITVNGTLAINDGDLHLDGRIVTLGPAAMLAETPGNTVTDVTGKIITTRNLNAPSGENVGGMGAMLTTTSNLGSTTIERSHYAATQGANDGIFRVFNIEPINNISLDATLRFYYDESELNGNTETNLVLYKSPDGSNNTWVSQGGTVNASENYVELSNIGSFSYWTLIEGATTTFQLTVNVTNGWNMVSVPGTNPDGQGVDTWWVNRDPLANVFKYAGGYQPITTTVPGIGYWMKHTGAQTYNTGDEWPAGGIQIVTHDPITAASGWNLFGGYELSVGTAGLTTNPPGLITGSVYKYSGGYQVATTLDPGYGYWVKLTGAGDIIIPDVLAKGTKEEEFFQEDWGKIVLTDATGINYTLYAVKGEVDLNQYELPPAPPEGMFDIRFESGRIAENINSSVKEIDLSGVTYPLTVKAENMDMRLMDETGKQINLNLKKGEDVVISDATIQKLMVSGELIPDVYSLEQNYPNPFNPSTVIEFSLPENVGSVKLIIYNTLGEKVAELVNTSLIAGKYTYRWDARNVATGMYIYELRTDKFVSVKKMMLLK